MKLRNKHTGVEVVPSVDWVALSLLKNGDYEEVKEPVINNINAEADKAEMGEKEPKKARKKSVKAEV